MVSCDDCEYLVLLYGTEAPIICDEEEDEDDERSVYHGVNKP